jgi:hypothetical protein
MSVFSQPFYAWLKLLQDGVPTKRVGGQEDLLKMSRMILIFMSVTRHQLYVLDSERT